MSADGMLQVFEEMHRLKNENTQLRFTLEQQAVRMDALLVRTTEDASLHRRLPELLERVTVSVDALELATLSSREQETYVARVLGGELMRNAADRARTEWGISGRYQTTDFFLLRMPKS